MHAYSARLKTLGVTRTLPRAITPARKPSSALTMTLAGCIVFPFLSGCAGQSATQSGFLSPQTYAQMAPPKGHSDDLVYISPDAGLRSYHRVIIDPVVWQPVGRAPKLTPEIEQRMTTAFQQELATALGKDFTIVSANSCGTCPDTLRVRAAITNLRRSKWYYNAIPVVVGFAAGAAGGGLPPIPPPAPGGASEELLSTDAQTGETLVALSTYNNGMPWNFVGQWLPYSHARRAFKLASDLLREELNATHVTAPPDTTHLALAH